MSSTSVAALQAIPNFRDAGGHRTRDGHRVRSGRLYRAVVLDAATDDDLAILAGLGITTVFDLRTAAERAHRPSRIVPGATHVPLDLFADSGEADPAAFFELLRDPPRASLEMADGATDRFYLASYRDMIRLPSARSGYARFFRSLTEPDAGAALVHCTTGKDRTGWAVASLLLWLGVGPDAVMRDYLVSDAEIRRAYRGMADDFVARGGSRDVIEPMMSVKPSYLDEAIETMLAEHGSIECYFSEGLGLDDGVAEALRDAFLE